MLFRRRARLHPESFELAPAPDEGVRVIKGEAFNAATAVARIERFVGAASSNMLQIQDRLGHLEAVTATLTEDLGGRPLHSDILEVRLQGARLDAEVRRLAVELRAEIAEIKDVNDGAPSRERRLATLADELLDLTRRDEAS